MTGRRPPQQQHGVPYGYKAGICYKPIRKASESLLLHAPAASAGNGSGPAAGLESTILDDSVMALLESVRMGQLAPAAAAMQLRERSAGYQQVLPEMTSGTMNNVCSHPYAVAACRSCLLGEPQQVSWLSGRDESAQSARDLKESVL